MVYKCIPDIAISSASAQDTCCNVRLTSSPPCCILIPFILVPLAWMSVSPSVEISIKAWLTSLLQTQGGLMLATPWYYQDSSCFRDEDKNRRCRRMRSSDLMLHTGWPVTRFCSCTTLTTALWLSHCHHIKQGSQNIKSYHLPEPSHHTFLIYPRREMRNVWHHSEKFGDLVILWFLMWWQWHRIPPGCSWKVRQGETVRHARHYIQLEIYILTILVVLTQYCTWLPAAS